VWNIPRPAESEIHPTMKPLALVERAIVNSSRPGDIVFDLFLGSGTQLIACERLGRRCYALEMEPAYVDVTVRRWEAFSGERVKYALTSRSNRVRYVPQIRKEVGYAHREQEPGS
jgi:DNA modification methylase